MVPDGQAVVDLLNQPDEHAMGDDLGKFPSASSSSSRDYGFDEEIGRAFERELFSSSSFSEEATRRRSAEASSVSDMLYGHDGTLES